MPLVKNLLTATALLQLLSVLPVLADEPSKTDLARLQITLDDRISRLPQVDANGEVNSDYKWASELKELVDEYVKQYDTHRRFTGPIKFGFAGDETGDDSSIGEIGQQVQTRRRGRSAARQVPQSIRSEVRCRHNVLRRSASGGAVIFFISQLRLLPQRESRGVRVRRPND